MRTLRVEPALTEAEAATLGGTLLGADSFDYLVAEDCDVLRPDGTPLLLYRAGVFDLLDCTAAHRGLREAAKPTDARGMAAGQARLDAGDLGREGETVREARLGFRFVKKDGTVSRQRRSPIVHSGIVGYFDRSTRFPYCRQTAFTAEHPEKFAAALPLIRRASEVFRQLCPERWEAQRAVVEGTAGDFVIPGTVFTTVTVNQNWQTAVHQDAGDLKEGFGVMAALRAGLFEGGYLCFPRWRVAVDLRTRGLLLADVHEWHGNTPLRGRSKGWERISLVMYYRSKMRHCGTAAEELARAKARQPGDPLK